MAFKSRLIATYGIILLITIIAWGLAIYQFSGYPVLLGSAFLAYTFGLRHAVDADHIAAIDNVTRKLMQDKKRPVNVGFFFSLGHSTVVLLASGAIALGAGVFKDQFQSLALLGNVVGTCISSFFLLILGAINVMIFVQVYRTFKRVKETGVYCDDDLNEFLSNRGFFARIFQRLLNSVSQSWQMFPIGFLFGLGFDTSTEIAVLGLTAAGALKGIGIWKIMIFPLLFTAGMTLIDTTDGVLMQEAYHWAFLTPIRKLYYNMTITALSVLVALVVAGIEALGLLGDQLSFKGAFWAFIGQLNENFNTIGFFIIGLFVLAWGFSFLIYHLKRYDELDIRVGQ